MEEEEEEEQEEEVEEEEEQEEEELDGKGEDDKMSIVYDDKMIVEEEEMNSNSTVTTPATTHASDDLDEEVLQDKEEEEVKMQEKGDGEDSVVITTDTAPKCTSGTSYTTADRKCLSNTHPPCSGTALLISPILPHQQVTLNVDAGDTVTSVGDKSTSVSGTPAAACNSEHATGAIGDTTPTLPFTTTTTASITSNSVADNDDLAVQEAASLLASLSDSLLSPPRPNLPLLPMSLSPSHSLSHSIPPPPPTLPPPSLPPSSRMHSSVSEVSMFLKHYQLCINV